MSTIANSVRIAASASVVAAAAALSPAVVANATPAAPLPQASIGSAFAGDTVEQCDPTTEPCTAALIGGSSTNTIIQNPLFWFGSANPDFQPIVGIIFPNIFGLNFEACLLGGALHLDPYGGGFIGLGAGC